MGMGSNSFANRSLRIISPISTPSFPDLGEIGQYSKCWFRVNSTSWRTLSQPHKLLSGNITESSESYSTILSSLLLNDGGEHGKTSECWQTVGSFLSSHLFSLMEASCHVVSCSVESPLWQGLGLLRAASEDLRPANSHMSDLGRGSCPTWALRWLQPLTVALWETLIQLRSQGMLSFLTHSNWEW